MPNARRDPELSAAWRSAKQALRSSLPETTFRMWLEPLRMAGHSADAIQIEVPEKIRTWVERRYLPLITSTLTRELGRSLRVELINPGTEADESDSMPPRPSLNPSYTFERFVIGETNRVAHAAALTVAEAPAEAYNPLFIYGRPGLGKTHLLCAIANYLSIHAPDLTVRYTTAEGFTQEFVTALRTSGIERFKTIYRDLDVLLVDDVQFLEGKQSTEDEFFHTFNALYDGGSQLVLSADRLPSELSNLAERLRDRFEWGFTVSMAQPTLATRQTIVERLVREAGLEISDRGALSTLAYFIESNVRQLHGALTRVIAHASLTSTEITSDLVERVLRQDGVSSAQSTPQEVNLDQILNECASVFQVPSDHVLGRSRTAKAAKARQAVVLIAREVTPLSLSDIGREFGRDHSTIHNSLKRAESQVLGDPGFAASVNKVRTRIHTHRAGS